jgi:hypothetical protein
MRIRRRTLLLLLSPLLLPVAAAYLQWATVGLPTTPPVPQAVLDTSPPQGFPAWLRVTHYVNFLFIILLVRSGLQILMDRYGDSADKRADQFAPADATAMTGV